MIDRIEINNFATIEHLSFDLGAGFNVVPDPLHIDAVGVFQPLGAHAAVACPGAQLGFAVFVIL